MPKQMTEAIDKKCPTTPRHRIQQGGENRQNDRIKDQLLPRRQHIQAKGDFILVVAQADVVGESAGDDEVGFWRMFAAEEEEEKGDDVVAEAAATSCTAAIAMGEEK